MKLKLISTAVLLLLVISSQAQRRRRGNNTNDTITTSYQPSELFSPLFYSEKGNEFHSANGEPGPKYWQNRVNYTIDAAIDTTVKTLTATEKVNYINNSPDALQYLWLQLDQNTYKKRPVLTLSPVLLPALTSTLQVMISNRLLLQTEL